MILEGVHKKMAKIQKAEAFIMAVEASEKGNSKTSSFISKVINESLAKDKISGIFTDNILVKSSEEKYIKEI